MTAPARLLGFLLLFAPSLGAAAGAPPAGWRHTLRAEGRLVFDTNVFLQEPTPLASGQTVRGCLADADDFAAIASAGVTFSFHPAGATPPASSPTRSLGPTPPPPASPSAAPAFEFSASAEQHVFETYDAENHLDLRAALSLRAATWQASLDLLEVAGAATSPVYNGLGGTPALGGAGVRARRDQTLVTGRATGTWALPAGLRARATAQLLEQNFHTAHAATPVGYANYVDRGQACAGAGLGLPFGPAATPFTAWLCVQAGRQWQADLLGVPHNFTNTFVRPLAGFEAKLHRTFSLSFTGGPDYRTFTAARPATLRRHRTVPYLEAAATWKPTARDTVTLSGREQLWLGGGGRSAYREIKTDLAATHQWTPATATALTVGVLHGNFGPYVATARHETIVTTALTTTHRLAADLRLEAGATWEDATTEVPATPARAYTRWLFSVGVTWTH